MELLIVWDGPIKWRISINGKIVLNMYPRDVNKTALDDDELYMYVIGELYEKLDLGGYYDLLRASALIRQLLLDDPPLAHFVNRDLKIKLRFRVFRYTIDPRRNPPAFGWSPVHVPDVEGIPPCEIVKHDQFLATPCMSMRGTLFTIRDVIKSCAHVRGGVHLDTGSVEGKDKDLLDFDQVCSVAGMAVSVALMRGIATSVVNGLFPLTEAIVHKSPKTAKQMGLYEYD